MPQPNEHNKGQKGDDKMRDRNKQSKQTGQQQGDKQQGHKNQGKAC